MRRRTYVGGVVTERGRVPALPLLALAIGLACLGLSGKVQAAGEGTTPPKEEYTELLDMLEEGIEQLTVSLNGLASRMPDVMKPPATMSPGMKDLITLDQFAWKLRQQRWEAQRVHLAFARDALRRARADKSERTAILQQWAAHQQNYERRLAALHDQREDLDKQRIALETRLIEQHLQ